MSLEEMVRICTHGVQTWNRLARRSQNLGIFVRIQTIHGDSIAGVHGNGVERAIFDGSETGVRELVRRVAVSAIVEGFPAGKVQIFAMAGEFVETFDCGG